MPFDKTEQICPRFKGISTATDHPGRQFVWFLLKSASGINCLLSTLTISLDRVTMILLSLLRRNQGLKYIVISLLKFYMFCKQCTFEK